MTQKLSVLTDINGVPTGGLAFPEIGLSYQTTLTALVEQTLTVPQNCNRAMFTFVPLGTWVCEGPTPYPLPSGSFQITMAELDPIDRQVTPGDTLRFISSNTTEINVRFFTDKNIYG